MSLARGTRLGPYEISEPLGAGGMGEVYRATDTRLRRQVAIKLVAERWQGQPDLHSRFRIEAEAIAALNHPHICQIYDIGAHDDSHFIVMEIVEGETLAARLTRGPLPIDQAQQVAAQIAGALGAAHRAGIIHRDVKPGNVILSRDGAKLLDFGLAQLSRPAAAPDAVGSTVAPRDLTTPGSPVGTWHYMSPEQIRGEATDARSDVFALGALMYEIVAGRRAFDGATHQELVAAILAADPPALETIVPKVPESYARIVRTCLSPSPEDRWNSAADVQRALEAARHDGRGKITAPASRAVRWAVTGAVAVAVALVGFVARPFIRSTDLASSDRNLVRSTLDLGRFEVAASQASIVFTPDGKSIIYQGGESGRGSSLSSRRLYRYSLATGTSDAIEGTEGGRTPFVSPDGRWLAFESFDPVQPPQLVKVPISGGRPQSITSTLYFGGYSWGDDGFIVMSGPPYSGLLRVSADGGAVTTLTTPRPDDARKDHRNPVVLPGSRTLLYSVGTGQTTDARIVAEDLHTGVRKDLLTGTMAFRYSPSGQIVYALAGVVFAQHFDVSALALTGAPVKIADGVINFTGHPEFAVSALGDLAFVPGSKDGALDQMALVTPAGEVTPVGEPGGYEKPRFSPDGNLISVVRFTTERNIWIYDLKRTTFGPVTFTTYLDAIWDAGGGLTLTEGRPRRSRLVSRPHGATAPETPVTPFIEGAELPIGWVDGGRRLLFERHAQGEDNIWSVEPGKQAKPEVVTRFPKNRTSVSPDGRWLSYTSAEADEAQVYLQRLDIAAPRVQVSAKGGTQGAWSPDSRRFYFYARATDVEERALWAVDIGGGPNPTIGAPVELFKTPDITSAFDMSPDGKAFVMVRHLDKPIHSLRLVQNWTALLDSPDR